MVSLGDLFAEVLRWWWSSPHVMAVVAITFGLVAGVLGLLHLSK